MQFFQQYFSLRAKWLRKSIQNLLISLLLIAISSSYTLAGEVKEPSGPLTLNDAFNLALSANPELAVAKRESEATAGIQSQASARPNPTLSAQMQDTRSASRETTIQVNQEIELGNKRHARMAAADALQNKTEAELENKKAEIQANVYAAFYEVLAEQARLNLAKSSLDIANLALDAAHKRVKAGKSSPVEETKSQIAASSAKIELNLAASQLVNSRKRLAALWGNTLPVFEQAEGDLSHISPLPAIPTLSAIIDSAPRIKIATLESQMREAMTTVERSKTVPNITVSAGVVNNQEVGANQALLGLSVPIPLFDRNQGNVQEALSRQYKADDELALLKNQMTLNLDSQCERFTAAIQNADMLRDEILPGARSAFDAATKGFTAGKFSFLDVLDAQRTLVQTQSQYLQSLLEAHQAMSEIKRILGDVIDPQRQL